MQRRVTYNLFNLFRIDTGDDNRVSKEEFTSDKIKASLEKWVGPIEDLEAEFDSIDTNSGGQVPKIDISGSFRQLLIANYHVKKFVRNSQ